MASMIELDNTEWALVEDLFDPPGREGAPARYPGRQVVDAILYLARTGCQWRYLPACYPPWEAVWQRWRRWRSTGVWAAAMTRIASLIRTRKGRAAKPSLVMIDVPREGRARLGFTPIAPLYRVEHAFARLGRWRRLSRCYEGTSEGARAWLEVAALAYLFARLRIELA